MVGWPSVGDREIPNHTRPADPAPSSRAEKYQHEEIIMMRPFRPTPIAAVLTGFVFTVGAGQALGSAFALQESSGSGLGNAFAGGAAAAEDASTIWANPAGMSRIGTNQLAGSIFLITPSTKFQNDGSLPALNQPLGGNGGDAGGTNVTGSVYALFPINNQWAFGLGVSVPFGLVTDYDGGWLGRYQALKSDVKTVNVNPAVSWKPTDAFTVGVGLDYQYIKATFTSNINYSAALLQAAGQAGLPPPTQGAIAAVTPGLDSFASIDGDDYAWGWNIGALFELDKNTRIGAAYRSGFKYNISGTVNFTNPTLPSNIPPTLAPVVGALSAAVNANLANSGITADIKLPSISNVSIFSRLNNQWDVMADVQFTNWSTLSQLQFVRTTGAILQTTPENFRNTWRGSVGANYRYSDTTMFRMGVAYDQSPVNTTDRTPRLPDNNRTWLSAGVQYKFTPQLALDVGATYIWINSPDINQNAGSTAANGLIKGHYDSYVTVFSGQLTYSF
jgi:long-chain fatty acid transport protein